MEEASYYLEARTGWTWGHWFQDASYWEGSLLNGGVPPSSTLIMEYDQKLVKIGISVEIPDSGMSDHGNVDRPLSADTLQNACEGPVEPSTINGDQTRSSQMKKSPLISLPEKRHMCNKCYITFCRPNELVAQLQTHSLEKPFECPQCDKSFAHKSSLKYHLNIHNEDKCFTCNVCHKSFSESGHSKVHQRVHSCEKPYTCSICGKSFTTNSNLKRHLLTHTKEKPHKCEHCGKCFSQSGTLKFHTRTHTGEKPLTCSTCGKRFADPCNLRRHSRQCTSTTTTKEDF